MKAFVVWLKSSSISGASLFNIFYYVLLFRGASRCSLSSVLKVECPIFLLCDIGWKTKQVEMLLNILFPAIIRIRDLLWGGCITRRSPDFSDLKFFVTTLFLVAEYLI